VEFRGVIKRSEDWWIGWLIDLPDVNPQERTKEQLIESLRIGAEDMMNTPYQTTREEELVHIKV